MTDNSGRLRVARLFEITRGTSSDYEAFARLFPELAVIEATPSYERFCESIAPESIFVRDGDVVAGYAWARVRGEKLHVVHVIVAPTHRRRGVGKFIMNALAERGRNEGFETWMLNVKPENTAARALYESCGMRDACESVSMRFRWSDVAKLEAAADVTARELAPDEDARFENAMSFDPKEVSNYRALHRLIFGAENSKKEIVGVGVFDRGFPGVSPFRISEPNIARCLFEKMHEHAAPEHESIFAFVENDPKLEVTLTKANAEPAMRVLRMEGKIPPA
jgi:ribosomal protein S18 acetylase RimI-like enzyme